MFLGARRVNRHGRAIPPRVTLERDWSGSPPPVKLPQGDAGKSRKKGEKPIGFEIADMRGLGADFSGEMVVYLEAGPNPITAEAWNTYVPDAGWIENTPRQPQFDQLIVLGSPYVPAGQFTSHTDSQGYTWKSVAAVQNRVYPFDADDYASYDPPLTTSAQAGYALTTPLPGTCAKAAT